MKQEQVTILTIIFFSSTIHVSLIAVLNLYIFIIILYVFAMSIVKYCEIRTNNTNGMTRESNILVPPNYLTQQHTGVVNVLQLTLYYGIVSTSFFLCMYCSGQCSFC